MASTRRIDTVVSQAVEMQLDRLLDPAQGAVE